MTRGKHVVSFSTMLNHVLKWKVKLFFPFLSKKCMKLWDNGLPCDKNCGSSEETWLLFPIPVSFTSPLRRPKIKFYRGYRKLGDINLHLLSKVNICTSLLTFFNYIMQFLNVFNKKKFAWYQTIKFNPIGLVLCIVSQRSSSGSQKTGSSLQNLWPILYDIGAFQMATQLKQF